MKFTPTEYPLRAGLIAPMPVHGTAEVSNGQADVGPVIVYSYGGSKLSSDLHAITELMVQQTSKELSKAAQLAPGGPKTIELKVNSLLSRYSVFHWNSNISFEAKLGKWRSDFHDGPAYEWRPGTGPQRLCCGGCHEAA